MTSEQQFLLTLIRRSLFQDTTAIEENVNWDGVFREAQLQAITGLVFDLFPEQFKAKKIRYYYQQVAHYTRYIHAQNDLLQLFSAAGIPLVILKGSAAAVYYPVPSQRTMGDIDFLVPENRFDQAVELMTRNEYTVTQHLEDKKERHISFTKNGETFELHHHFSYRDLDIEKYLINGMKEISSGTIGNFSFPMLPDLANGLVLLAHLRSHLKGGLGLRQVIDWMLFCDKVLTNEFWETEFKEAATSVGLDKLAITTTRMCQMYLGLSDQITWCNGAVESLATKLLETLFTSGNFGRKQGNGRKIELIALFFKREGFFRYLQYAGEHNWKAYQKYKWLKPFCWVYQICRYFRQGIKAGRGIKILSDLRRSTERVELLKELGI